MTRTQAGQVTDDRHASRYEIFVGAERAGLAVYRLEPESVAFVHTQIEPDLAGQGLGSRLARWALDDVRSQGKRVVPLCPFIAAFIARHAEYADLVDDSVAWPSRGV